MDIPWNDFRVLGTGETFGFTRVAPPPARHMSIIVPEYRGHSTAVANIRFGVTLFNLALGLLLFFRRRGDFGAESLGMAFVVTTITSNFPSQPYWSIFWTTIAYSGVALAPFLILAFAMTFYDEHTKKIRIVEKSVYGLFALGLLIDFVILFPSNRYAYSSPITRLNQTFVFCEVLFAYTGTVFYFLRGYAVSKGSLSARYAFLLAALFLTFCLTAVQTYSFLVLKLARMDPENPLYDVNVVLSFLGPLLFSYAVLRHRVVDLGFVINRTIVYGGVSVVLLSAFGLAEWVVEHVLKPEGRGASAVLDAAIAVGIYLAFHRVRDFVERNLEAVFFRRWHDNEKRLNRFVSDAGFIADPDNLKAAFLAELKRFTEGAQAALYLERSDAGYRSFEPSGAFPAAIGLDDPIVVALRARRTGIEPGGTATRIAAAHALPMLHRHDLLGFVLLGHKPDGADFRPDELDALSDATHKIGLDLQSLRIDVLDGMGTRLTEKIRHLEFENGILKQLVGPGEARPAGAPAE
jgi:uncharacterized membrane protein